MLNNDSLFQNFIFQDSDLDRLSSVSLYEKSIESFNEEKFNLKGNSLGNNEKKIESEKCQKPENNNESIPLISTKSKTKNSSQTNKLKKDSVRLGRKRKGSQSLEKNEHNKYSDDNLRRKVKGLILRSLLNFINEKIKEKYQTSNEKDFINQLHTINHKQTADATVKFNKSFLKKTIGDIFSVDISKRYSVISLAHNRNLIKSLMEDKDNDNRRQYFDDLFNLSFGDALQHYGGIKKIEQLNGMKTFDSIKEEFENDEDYLKLLNYHISDFEKILSKKRIRNGKKNINVEDNKNH